VVLGELTFRRALREELDVHSGIFDLKVLEHGVDAHFIAVEDVFGVERVVKASSVWGDAGFAFRRDVGTVAVFARNDFRYPQLTVYGRLPRLEIVGDETFQSFWVGFENGRAGGNSLVAFRKMYDTATGLVFQAKWYDYFGWRFGKSVDASILPYLPADNETADHQYIVRFHRNMVAFEVDNSVVAFAIPCNRVGVVKSGVKPYSIFLVERIPERLSPLIEWGSDRSRTATSDLYVYIDPSSFRVSEGVPVPNLQLPLYLEDSDARLAGYSVSSGSVVSHPFPVMGFAGKTFYFMASQGGVLEVQVYTLSGSWRTYDTISIPADTLYGYKMTGDAVLARAVFTPSAYPASILEAEVILNAY
jgi:hypothetical protein